MQTTSSRRPGVREFACVALLSLIGAACVPEFQNPLPVAPDMRPDPALLGTWAGAVDADNGSQVSFFPRANGWMDIVHITDSNGSVQRCDVSRYEGYSTTVEDERYLCLRVVGDPGVPVDATNGYYIARYAIAPADALAIQLFDQKSVRALIEQDALQGTITEGEHVDTIRVTSSPARLVAAILEAGAGAFVSTNDTMRFTRMRVAGE
ncbi:MAG: hypothetical protein O3B24_06610 [Verrucomicrobia bacterium]|nr:hypothetical protein [Verrucomicrobiota bacterium]